MEAPTFGAMRPNGAMRPHGAMRPTARCAPKARCAPNGAMRPHGLHTPAHAQRIRQTPAHMHTRPTHSLPGYDRNATAAAAASIYSAAAPDLQRSGHRTRSHQPKVHSSRPRRRRSSSAAHHPARWPHLLRHVSPSAGSLFITASQETSQQHSSSPSLVTSSYTTRERESSHPQPALAPLVITAAPHRALGTRRCIARPQPTTWLPCKERPE